MHRLIAQYQQKDQTEGWLEFCEPQQVIEATSPAEVLPALRAVEAAVAQGACAAGYMTYEAASGLDPALKTHANGVLPLLRFGIYHDYQRHATLPKTKSDYSTGNWSPSISIDAYQHAIEFIKEWIARGHTYQVNFTLRLLSQFSGDPWPFFCALWQSQQPKYAAYVEDGPHHLCSVSPELFFRLDGEQLVTRPMKGTVPRGRTLAEDEAQRTVLQASVKNRAENIMIVDMMRNDLGRIAPPGSIQVAPLLATEQYPTLWQLTSTVEARTTRSFDKILTALFPSCSITGAPKIRTMELIRELEPGPRGIYTGAIGFLLPRHPDNGDAKRFAQFNVAIRTVHVNTDTGQAEYGTGGGIVWDSEALHEYEECQTKALILSRLSGTFDLLETLLWKPSTGYFLLEFHLDRLSDTANYFGYAFDRDAIRHELISATAKLPPERHRVRLLLNRAGEVTIQTTPIKKRRSHWRVALDDRPIDDHDPFLFHKTTARQCYEAARARFPDHDDVLLWNERNELTESCIANLALKLAGQWYTPPVECGLLNGTARQVLLRRGRIKERILYKNDLHKASDRVLFNSVRGGFRFEIG